MTPILTYLKKQMEGWLAPGTEYISGDQSAVHTAGSTGAAGSCAGSWGSQQAWGSH